MHPIMVQKKSMMLNDLSECVNIDTNTQNTDSTVLNIIEVNSDSELDLPLGESQCIYKIERLI